MKSKLVVPGEGQEGEIVRGRKKCIGVLEMFLNILVMRVSKLV